VLLALGWYAQPLHQGVAQYARQVSWVLNIDLLRGGSLRDMLSVDGVIFVAGSNPEADAAIARLQVPAVSIGPVTGSWFASVMPDNAGIGALAAEHFVARGFRHYAFYTRWGTLGEELRRNAFRDALGVNAATFANLNAGTLAHKIKHNTRKRLEWLGARLLSLPKPLAVMAEFDDHAIEVIHACQLSGIAVPEQVAVLGVDDDPLRCDFAPVPLSSVNDDQPQQGYQAAALLDRLMKGEPLPKKPLVVPPMRLTTRQSSDILAIQNPHVASALRTIWAHYREPLTAEDVAQTVPLSHRRLHDLFQACVGRTMAGEIARRRVEHACKLLTETDMKIQQVAWESGFSSADRMARVFKRLLGRTPQSCRIPRARRGERSGDVTS
jgi:LacI family transcriptional regulator